MGKISELLVKNPKYSTFNLSKTVRTTMAPGWVYPVYHKLINTGDRFRFDIRSFLRTNPVFAPVMGSYKLRIATFVSSLHNYIPTMDYNRSDVDVNRVALPMFRFRVINNMTAGRSDNGSGATVSRYAGAFVDAPYNNETGLSGRGFVRQFGVNETSLFKFLGYPRGWVPSSAAGYGEDSEVLAADTGYVVKTAIPYLVYLDTYRNYFVNPQETTYPACAAASSVSDPSDGWSRDVSSPYPRRYDVSGIDDFLDNVRSGLISHYKSKSNDPFYVNDIILSSTGVPIPASFFMNSNDSSGSALERFQSYNLWSLDHGCLCSATYDPDLNNNWMSVINHNAYSDVAISVSNRGNTGSFTYEQLVRGSRQYDFAIRDAASGGRVSDILYSQFGVEVRGDMHIPQLIHTMEIPINFEDITSMSDTSGDPATPDAGNGAKLGEQGGVGRGFGSCRPFTINNTSRGPAYIMVMAWIVPNVDYSQNMEVDKDYAFLSDLYYPSFDNYALQPRTFEQLYAAPAVSGENSSTSPVDVMSPTAVMYAAPGYPNSTAMGFQPAYSEMMTDYNEVHGLFCSDLDYWVISRRWPRIISGSSYYGIDASAYICASSAHIVGYNFPFSVQDGDDNFQVQFRFDVKATRPKSKAAIPHVL